VEATAQVVLLHLCEQLGAGQVDEEVDSDFCGEDGFGGHVGYVLEPEEMNTIWKPHLFFSSGVKGLSQVATTVVWKR